MADEGFPNPTDPTMGEGAPAGEGVASPLDMMLPTGAERASADGVPPTEGEVPAEAGTSEGESPLGNSEESTTDTRNEYLEDLQTRVGELTGELKDSTTLQAVGALNKDTNMIKIERNAESMGTTIRHEIKHGDGSEESYVVSKDGRNNITQLMKIVKPAGKGAKRIEVVVSQHTVEGNIADFASDDLTAIQNKIPISDELAAADAALILGHVEEEIVSRKQEHDSSVNQAHDEIMNFTPGPTPRSAEGGDQPN
jgi:hypothetical protein